MTTSISSSASIVPESRVMAREVELFHTIIVEQLRGAGVQLPEAVNGAVADVILAEAVRVSLLWLENG
jgi:hypothetical protein